MIYDELEDIHFMAEYRAHDGNYGLFPANILYCSHKLNDIYLTYCTARANLHYLDNKDFGDFAKDEFSIKYVKSILVMNALHNYNIIIDLSWQLIWFYIRTDLNNHILTTKIYESVAKECNFEILSYTLTLVNEQKIKKYYLEDFFQENVTQKVREMWNFTKHRGTFYFEGLGINDSQMMGRINNLLVPIVNRTAVNVDDIKHLLIEFDKKYFIYINNLINIIFPKEYRSTNDMLSSMINYYLNNKQELIDWNNSI
jgi:hypothetical protein